MLADLRAKRRLAGVIERRALRSHAGSECGLPTSDKDHGLQNDLMSPIASINVDEDRALLLIAGDHELSSLMHSRMPQALLVEA